MVIDKPHLCTRLEVWTPKYDNKSLTRDYGEQVALVHKRKVDMAGSSTLLVSFPKAKHLQGQRFAIKKQDAQRHAIGTNRVAPTYEIPMSHFSHWASKEEEQERILETVNKIGW